MGIAARSRPVVAALLLLLAGAAPALACRCVEPDPAAAYRRAGAVALVRITAVEAPDARGVVGAVAAVAEAWKAPVAAEIRLTGAGTNCDLALAVGASYVLFLPPGPEPHVTQRCAGSREGGRAEAALGWLRREGRRTR